MKAITQKIVFKLKKNKSQTQQAILLNQMYSTNMRELYQLLNQKDKLPKHKFTRHLFQQLAKLQQNMLQQLNLYQPYYNSQLQQYLSQTQIPNGQSLISLSQDKQNQIQNIKPKLTQNIQQKLKKSNLTDKKLQIQKLRQNLQEQRIKKTKTLIKIEKIKQQLQKQTKIMIENKINNFDQQLQFRKLQKSNQSVQKLLFNQHE